MRIMAPPTTTPVLVTNSDNQMPSRVITIIALGMSIKIINQTGSMSKTQMNSLSGLFFVTSPYLPIMKPMNALSNSTINKSA